MAKWLYPEQFQDVDPVQVHREFLSDLMKLDYDNKRTRHSAEINGTDAVESKSPLELFAEFYELQNNAPMSEGQADFMRETIEKIWEDEQ